MTRPSISSGTPMSDRTRSRSTGLTTSISLRSSRMTGTRLAAIRPAMPRPTGMSTCRSTSSSSPREPRAARWPPSSVSSTIVTLSLCISAHARRGASRRRSANTDFWMS